MCIRREIVEDGAERERAECVQSLGQKKAETIARPAELPAKRMVRQAAQVYHQSRDERSCDKEGNYNV